MFKKIFQHSSDILTRQQTSILSAAFIIMSMTLVSKLLAFVKFRLLVHYFGDGLPVNAFLAADGLPDLLYDILIFSILSVSFIPLFTSYLAKQDQERASRLASQALNITLAVYFVIAVGIFIFAAPIGKLLAPGLIERHPEALDLIVKLLRLTIPAQLVLIIAGYVTAILQANQRFLVPAIATTFYNVGIIIGIIVLAPLVGIYAAVWGMLLGALLQLVLQLPFLRKVNFHYKAVFSADMTGIKDLLSLSAPRMVSATISQVAERLNVSLASLVSDIAIVAWSFAFRLSTLPLSVFAAAIAQAALPSLSLAWAKDDREGFLKTLFASLNQILFFVLPVAAAFIALRLPLVRLVYGSPKLTWLTTVAMGRVLAVIGIGLIGQALILLLARAFYATHHTKTPLIINLSTLCLNIVLSVTFVRVLHKDLTWLAGAYAVTNTLNAALLFAAFRRRIGGFPLSQGLTTPGKLLVCGAAMTGMMYLPLKLMDLYIWEKTLHVGPFTLPNNLQLFILDTRYTVNLILLMLVALLLGGITYLGLAIVLGVDEVNIVSKALLKIPGAKRILVQSPELLTQTDDHIG